jgi:acyl-CoA thioesterase-1
MIMRRTLLLLGLAGLTLACGEGERQPVVRDEASEVSAEEGRTSSDTEASAVLFLGTSLTAGYGLTSEEAYPALIQEKIDSAGLEFRVVNAGVSGETSAAGLRRIDWLLRQPLAALVIELGANDMLRGHDIGAMRANLQEIIDRTRVAHPRARIVIAGMKAAPNLGEPYASEFESTFPELARDNDAALIPFLLRDVAAVPELNQPDGNHPTAEGQRIVAENVWSVLEPILRDIESDAVTR